VNEVSWGDMSPTVACQQVSCVCHVPPTVYAVYSNDIFEDRCALICRLPVQCDAICLDSSERDEGRDGDFEAEDLDELLDGLREDLVCAEGDPT
jgi:hypothetical protein